jgi:hypothetical protein
MFVGRGGQSAAILCLNSAEELIGPGGVVMMAGGTVLVGTALASTLPDGGQGWRLGGSRMSLSRGEGRQVRSFLSSLHGAVARAAGQPAAYPAANTGSAFVQV